MYVTVPVAPLAFAPVIVALSVTAVPGSTVMLAPVLVPPVSDVAIVVASLMTVVPGATQAGSNDETQVSCTTTLPVLAGAPTRVTRNCGSPVAVFRLSADRSIEPVASSEPFGRPSGLPAPLSNSIEPEAYVLRAGEMIWSDGTSTGCTVPAAR